MRVRISESVHVETDVIVEVDDIRTALCERLDEAEDEGGFSAIHEFCSGLHQCLNALTDEMIARMSPENRKLVYLGLKLHVDRFRPEETA